MNRSSVYYVLNEFRLHFAARIWWKSFPGQGLEKPFTEKWELLFFISCVFLYMCPSSKEYYWFYTFPDITDSFPFPFWNLLTLVVIEMHKNELLRLLH